MVLMRGEEGKLECTLCGAECDSVVHGFKVEDSD